MTASERPNHDSSESWTEQDIYQLYQYMDATQPTFQSSTSHDPFVLAQDFQHTMDGAHDPDMRKIMGEAGEEILNKLAPNQLTYRHLAIMTSRLIVLSEPDGEIIGDYATKTLVTGLFDRFAFEGVDQEPYVEKDWLAVKLVKPEFLFAKSRKIALELFDADKDLIGVESGSRLTIPVQAVQGQVYNPERLF